MSKKEVEVYCIFCGTKNINTNKKCKKCKRKLKQNNNLWRDFIRKRVYDDVEGKVKDFAYDRVKAIIFKYLYGITLSVAVGFAAGATIANALNGSPTKRKEITITKKPELVCKYTNTKELTVTCPKGYSLEGEVCTKITSTNAKSQKTCNEGYTLNGNRCLSDATSPIIETKSCNVPDDFTHTTNRGNNGGIQYFTWGKKNIFKVEETADKCYIYWCGDPAKIDHDLKICNDDMYEGGENIDKFVSKSCPAGESIVGSVCRRVQNFKQEYSCDDGVLNGTKCEKKEEIEPTIACPEGYIYNDKCKVCTGDEDE